MSCNKKTIVNVIQSLLLNILVNFTPFLLPLIYAVIYIQIGKIKASLIDSQPEDFS